MKYFLIIFFFFPLAVFGQQQKIKLKQLQPANGAGYSIGSLPDGTPIWIVDNTIRKTDTAAMLAPYAAKIAKAFTSIAQINDSTFTLNRYDGTRDTIVFTGGTQAASGTADGNKFITGFTITGTGTKTLTATYNDGTTQTATFTDLQGSTANYQQAFNSITQINDSTFTLNRYDGTKDTVQIRVGSAVSGSGGNYDKAFMSIAQISDSSFTLNRYDGTKDTIVFTGGSNSAAGAMSFGTLTNVDTTGLVNGSIAKWNDAVKKWQMATESAQINADWNASSGPALILNKPSIYTQTQINNFFYGTSAISGYNKSNWDAAFGWGNHALAGYITSLAHNHGIANSAGVQQFTFGVNDNIRFEGTGNATVSFDPLTKKVIINAVAGAGADGNKYITALTYTGTTTKTVTATYNDGSTATLGSFTDLQGGFTPSGTSSQYIAGDGTYKPFPTDLSQFANGPGYIANLPIKLNNGTAFGGKGLNINCTGCTLGDDLNNNGYALLGIPASTASTTTVSSGIGTNVVKTGSDYKVNNKLYDEYTKTNYYTASNASQQTFITTPDNSAGEIEIHLQAFSDNSTPLVGIARIAYLNQAGFVTILDSSVVLKTGNYATSAGADWSVTAIDNYVRLTTTSPVTAGAQWNVGYKLMYATSFN